MAAQEKRQKIACGKVGWAAAAAFLPILQIKIERQERTRRFGMSPICRGKLRLILERPRNYFASER